MSLIRILLMHAHVRMQVGARMLLMHAHIGTHMPGGRTIEVTLKRAGTAYICMYMYVCIHTYIYVYIHRYVCVCMYTYIHMYMYVCMDRLLRRLSSVSAQHTYICICMYHTYVYVCIHTHIHICIHAYICICMYVYIHTYVYVCITFVCVCMYTYIHMYMYMYVCTDHRGDPQARRHSRPRGQTQDVPGLVYNDSI